MTREKAIRIARRHLDASGLNSVGLYPAEWLIDAILEAAQEVEKFDGSWRIKNIGEDPVFDSICVNVALLLGIRTNMDAPWFGPNGRAISENIAANLKSVSEDPDDLVSMAPKPRTPVAWYFDYPDGTKYISWLKTKPTVLKPSSCGDWQPLYAD